MRFRMYQLDKKEPPDEQIKAILSRHIKKYGPPPLIMEVNPSTASQLTPCQDATFEVFQHVQPHLVYIEIKEDEATIPA